MRVLPALLVALLGVAASGCATLLRGPTDTVVVAADRDSAFVFVDGLAAGVAPAELGLRRASPHHVEVIREGMRPAQAEVTRSANTSAGLGAIAGGLAGGLPGLLVDATSGAIYDLDPDELWFELEPDSAGVDAAYVSGQIQLARAAQQQGFADGLRYPRKAAPWMTAQVTAGTYVGGTPASATRGPSDRTTGGFGVNVLLGLRSPSWTARLSATASSGFLFDNSERWELAALVGGVVELEGGTLRLGLAAGPGLAGGRESDVCLFFCGDGEGTRETFPTRLGVSVLAEAYVFVTPQVGLGLQAPFNLRAGDTLRGVMIGWKFEGL